MLPHESVEVLQRDAVLLADGTHLEVVADLEQRAARSRGNRVEDRGVAAGVPDVRLAGHVAGQVDLGLGLGLGHASLHSPARIIDSVSFEQEEEGQLLLNGEAEIVNLLSKN